MNRDSTRIVIRIERRSLRLLGGASALIGGLALPSMLLAGTVTIPFVFTDGDFMIADEVNANFSAVEAEIDDNAAEIATNTANRDANIIAIGVNTTDIGGNTTAIGVNTAAIGANASAISTNAADMGANVVAIAANRAAIASTAGDIATTVSSIAATRANVDNHPLHNVRTLFSKGSADGVCSGIDGASSAVHVPGSYRGQTGTAICAADSRGKNTCVGVPFRYVTNEGGNGAHTNYDKACGDAVSHPWPWGANYSGVNSFGSEWEHGNTWIVCCK